MIRSLFVLSLFLSVFLSVGATAADPPPVFHPASLAYQSGPVDNPLKGLVPYADPHRDRFPHSMEFHYLPLSDLVIDEDSYDWQPLEKLLDAVASRSNQTVFRIFLEYPNHENVLPEFLIRRGLKVDRWLNTNTAPLPPAESITPDYENPLLRATLQKFIAALGQRYDGDVRIGYITAGLLGTWGEWHTYPKNELFASKDVQTEVYEAYQNAFKKTPVLLRYPAGKDNYHYADSTPYGFGYHDDSFAHSTIDSGQKQDDWFFWPSMRAAGLTDRWRTAPIGGEIRPEVWGCCFDEPPCTPETQSFDECRDQTHVTWLMDTGMFRQPADPRRLDRALAAVAKMGYDIHLSNVEVRYQDSQMRIEIEVQNRGIAPFYHVGWNAQLRTDDDDDVIDTDWSPRMIQPGESKVWSSSFEMPQKVSPSRLEIRIPNPMEGGKPLRFANKNSHPDGWLPLGTFEN